ncbi:hypothetical protein DPMN_170740 [Dreissena polymorpha]|uniref:Uncharacterized protein n=1 Tax=Dreissena polymorpha TaxID=45954 RepID=A0A9D4E0D0_DREPO|nr:hypothetical protein DPMN_170740 [Dreissena polymorpha]
MNNTTFTHLQIPQLGEGVDNNTEDDVEANSRDEYEEGHVVQHDGPKRRKRSLVFGLFDHLQNNTQVNLTYKAI